MYKTKKIKLIFIIYWILLAYIMAALIWWYIALSLQNHEMTDLRIQLLDKTGVNYDALLQKVEEGRKRKMAQYLGEGAIFLLLISAGAIFVYRAVNKQLKISLQQQNFMIAVTHELKTPIAVTKLNLETMQKRKLDEQQQKKLLQNVIQEANRMDALCNNMLLSSQIEAGGYQLTKEDENISDLVNGCVNDFQLRFPDRIIKSEIVDNLFVVADSLLIKMAINNLIDNGLKYSSKDQTVFVSLANKNEKVYVKVSDNGPGIPDEEKGKVFQKFYRLGNKATKQAKGTGLGLYLTKNIVAVHKGGIAVEDNKEGGSVFIIELKQAV